MRGNTPARLKALRRSHCDTCGCVRCTRIDAQLDALDATAPGHPGGDAGWLLEGRLLQTTDGSWVLRGADGDIPLSEALDGWEGHEVVIMFGQAAE